VLDPSKYLPLKQEEHSFRLGPVQVAQLEWQGRQVLSLDFQYSVFWQILLQVFGWVKVKPD
jgi:hypothetical protein